VPDNVDNVRARVGAALKHWRTHRGLTQEGLAEQSGLSYKFIGEIERGSANPTIETLSTLARALGVEIAELLASHDQTALEYQLSKKHVQRIREAADVIDGVLRQLTGSPARRTRRRK
jgi:transcriptional regulator with XRE-family HTH domain